MKLILGSLIAFIITLAGLSVMLTYMFFTGTIAIVETRTEWICDLAVLYVAMTIAIISVIKLFRLD